MRLLHRSTCIYKTIRFSIILLFIQLAFNNDLFCQQLGITENIYVTAYSTDNGLRQSMVSQVCQDERGLIWMVTGDGLHFFDGQEFRAFRVPFNEVNNHTDNVMRYLVESESGKLLVASTSSLLTFNTASGKFNTIYRREGFCPVLFKSFIDRKPLAWISGLNFCLVNNTKLEKLKFEFKDGAGFPASFIPSDAVRTTADQILICGETGIIAIILAGRISDSVIKADWYPLPGCRAIVKTVKGKTLILEGSKLLSWDKNRKMSLYFDTKLDGNFDIFSDSRENIWLSDKITHKIFRLSDKKLTEIKLYSRNGKFTESLSPAIISIFEDSEKNLWFGTDGSGVLQYSPGQVQYNKSDIGFTRCITAFEGNIWAGTYNNGLWKLSPDLVNAKRVSPSQFNNAVYFLDMIPDYSGRLWIATRNGLEIIDASGKSVWTYNFNCLDAEFISRSNDKITISINNKLLQFKATGKPVLIDSISYIVARAFLEVDNFYWVGTQFGLYRYNKVIGFNSSKAFDNEKHKRSSIPVYGLTFHEGLIWVATGNGIECYNSDGSKHELGEWSVSLKNDVVYSVLPDKQGRIWYTGNNGMGCINVSENQVIFFNTKNNLQSLEFNHNAALQTDNGNLYFGGIHGLNRINPSDFNPDKEAPVAQLISLIVSDTAFSPGIPHSKLNFKLSRLAPHVNGKVFSPDYMNAGSLLFSFFLEGYQTEWSKPSTNAAFTYRNLPPGKYSLLVKCADTYMNWGKPEKLMSFTISPAFYTTLWFRILMVISIIGATILLVKKVQQMRYRNQLREIEREFAIEKERLRISKDMHDEVGASLTRISILSELAKKQQNEPEKERQIINQISEISGDVVDEMSEIIWAMNPRNDKLDSFTSYIRQHASSYLESAEIEGTFTFPDEIPAFPMSSELRRNLFLTVKEAFHNIAKHSGAGKVHMSLHFEKLSLKIIIEDDGVGFDQKKINGWGNGLTNMHKRIEELGGSFYINSEVGKGTLIEFAVRLKGKEISH